MTGLGPRKVSVFLAKMNILQRGRKKGAFGACIVGLGALPQSDHAKMQLYKLQMHSFGKSKDSRERRQTLLYVHEMRVGFLFGRRFFEF